MSQDASSQSTWNTMRSSDTFLHKNIKSMSWTGLIRSIYCIMIFAGAEKGRIVWKVGLQMDSKHDSLFSFCTSRTAWGTVKSGAWKWCWQLVSAEATSRIWTVVSNFQQPQDFAAYFQLAITSQYPGLINYLNFLKAFIISSVSFVSVNIGKLYLVNQSFHLPQKRIRQEL